MSNETLIRAWKDAQFRSTLADAEIAANPAGERLVEIDDAELRAVWGGVDQIRAPSEGYVCGVSGEVTGTSCWR
jgi:mersacidin/lichenicidin family type 2 lantibiotic